MNFSFDHELQNLSLSRVRISSTAITLCLCIQLNCLRVLNKSNFQLRNLLLHGNVLTVDAHLLAIQVTNRIQVREVCVHLHKRVCH